MLVIARFILILLILTGTGCSVTADLTKAQEQPPEDTENRYAVVVGVNGYQHYPPLDYSVADSDLLAEVLSRKGYQVRRLQNTEADPDSILDILRKTGELIQKSGGDGTLIFAFSGHGFQQDGTNYIATGSTHPDRLRQTALSIDRIKRVLRNNVPGRRILLIDACRNDPTRSGASKRLNYIADTDAEGLAILYSTAAGAWSWEDPKIGQGVFSHYVAKALDNRKIALDDKITFNQLASSVSREVKTHVYKRWGRTQIPYHAGERTGDFVLASASLNNNRDRFPWREISMAVGAVAIGALLSSAGGRSDDNTQPDEGVTLILPTP
ncbi:hypothetical protein AB833_31605 [Chromatiales bacterium (ex Bugula neritina AB1)]|nr:hypothetical protein AB833_31605 [Chromatiales bacterium (ex Bugula neritina AB1)]